MAATNPVGREHRRSHRIPLSVNLFVSSLDPNLPFFECCQTVDVNNHGCSFYAHRPFQEGTRLRLAIPHNSWITDKGPITKGHVVHTLALKRRVKMWKIGLELDNPEDVRGVQSSTKQLGPNR